MNSHEVHQDSNVVMTVHGWLFIDIHFALNDTPKGYSTSTRTINICLSDPSIYTISFLFFKYFWIVAIPMA